VPVAETETIALSIDSGHERAVRSYQVRTFEVFVALAGNDDGQQIVFSSVPVEADRQTQQLRGVLHRLGATPCTEAIILSDCAVEHIRWRLWHGQVQRALDLMGDTLAALDVTAATPSPAATTAGKIAGALRGLESYVATQAALIIDYATARHCEKPISTAATERSASDAEGPDLIGQRHLRSGPCCR
jgi:hypothetical protein